MMVGCMAVTGEEIKGQPSASEASIKGMVIVISLYMLLNLALVMGLVCP